MHRQISTIFCDDIRQEIGSKLSLMGVYSGVMFVDTFPVILPKLCVSITATTSSNNPFKEISFKVFKGEDILAENRIDSTKLVELSANQNNIIENDGDKIHMINMGLVFAPLQIEKECVIRIRVYAEDGQELRGPGLSIKLGDRNILSN